MSEDTWVIQIWNIIASILLLGNLEFVESNKNVDESLVKDREALKTCAKILRVGMEELERALCKQVSRINSFF